MHFSRPGCAAALLLCASQVSHAIDLDLNDPSSIRSAASAIAFNMASYYQGNQSGQIPGELPQPYYWWECGAMFGSLINYWYYTGDPSYNDIVTQGMIFQNGGGDFMPSNQTLDLGNDDQMFWAFAAMSAAEYNFPNPPPDQPQWLALAQGVFNSQAGRWDITTCGGGIHWQIYQTNPGWNYKNTPANGGFFNLASRLGAYTGNETYFWWANTMWDWMYAHGLISPTGQIFDGTTPVPNNCTTVDHDLWTYNAGMMLNGAAVMWNQTDPSDTFNRTLWYNRTLNIWDSSKVFFTSPGNIMFEYCEPKHTCDFNSYSFKAYYARFAAASSKVAPWLAPLMQPYLAASAAAAAGQCTGPPLGASCGSVWNNSAGTAGTYDGSTGVGQAMSALEIIQGQLVANASAPVSSSNGGTSKGDPSAGSGDTTVIQMPLSIITGSDKAGAGVLTAAVVVITLAGVWFMLA